MTNNKNQSKITDIRTKVGNELTNYRTSSYQVYLFLILKLTRKTLSRFSFEPLECTTKILPDIAQHYDTLKQI